jgi:O-antigen/teichoic acid export membrane protein
LERLNNNQEFGYYNLGFTIAGFIGTFFITLYMAFEPDLYKHTEQRNLIKFMKLSMLYIMILTFASGFALLVSKHIVGFLTSYRYIEATKYVNIFIISMYFYSIGNIFEQVYNSLNQNRLSLYRAIIVGSLSFFIYYLFINKLGFLGAAYSRVLIFILYFLIGLLFFIFKYPKQAFLVLKLTKLTK